MKSAGTEHSKNKYTLKRNVDTFNFYGLLLFYIDYSMYCFQSEQKILHHKSYDLICI